jgi:hypothetical protein
MSSVETARFWHHLTIVAEPDPSILARILAPFAVHDVMPKRLSAAADVSGTSFVICVEFDGHHDIATRLAARIAAMPAVHRLTHADTA